MKYGALLLLFLSLFLGIPRTEAGLVRVVSQTVGTDELLLAVAEPAQIAALSHRSREADFSTVTREAMNYPQIAGNGDIESILKYKPTILLCADYSRGEIVLQAKRAGLKVIVLSRYRTLQDSYENLRLIARELGPDAEARAESVIGDCERRVAELARRLNGVRPVRVIAPSTYGVIPGADTTFQDMCEHAGAENLAATLGGLRGHQAPPVESLLRWPIEQVVVVGSTVDGALEPFRKLPPYQFLPAIRDKHAAVLDPPLISCVTHHRVEGYEALARQLHPERFQ